MNKNLDDYEINEIIENAFDSNPESVNEQSRNSYSPDQLSIINLLDRARRSPRGSSTLADVIRGAYSLPGTEGEMPRIPPEDLTIKNVYFQSVAFALRASILATSPPAQIFTLARLMFDTPPPRTATDLITTIAAAWGNAAKDIIDDAVIRAYRTIDYSINKIIIPIAAPLLALLSSGALASAVEGRIGGNVLTVMENPTEVNKITATQYNYSDSVLKLQGQINDNDRFIRLTFELVDYLINYLDLYNQGLSVWQQSGISRVGEDFGQLLFIQWNDTIAKVNPSFSISSGDNMQKIVMELRKSNALDDDLKNAIVDFFSSVRFDENGGWTVIAGTAGSKSIPLPLIDNAAPVKIEGKDIINFTPNSFFKNDSWTEVYWKFISEDIVVKSWIDSVENDPSLFFDSDDFLNNIIASGDTVFSTNSALRTSFISKASSYYESLGNEEEARQKVQDLQKILQGSKASSKDGDAKNSAEDSSSNLNLKDIEKRFAEGSTSYYDFTGPLELVVHKRWEQLVSGLRLSPAVMKTTKDYTKKALGEGEIKEVILKVNPKSYKEFIDKIIESSIMPQIRTTDIIAKADPVETNLEGELANKFKEAYLTGASSPEEFVKEAYPAIRAYATTIILDYAYDNTEFTEEQIAKMLSDNFTS